MDILDDLNAGDGEVAKWILPLIFPELNARTLQEKGNQHLLQDNVARLAGNLQSVASSVAAYSEALQTQWRAIAVLAKGQGQTTNDMQELRALIESVVAGVTDVAREQGAVHGTMRDSTKVLSAAIEAIQQGQRTLQTEAGNITDAAKQTRVALAAAAAEQTAVHETVKRMMEAVTGVAARQTALGEAVQAHEQAGAAATAAQAGRQEQLAGDVRRLHELTQTVAGSVTDVVREQAATRGAMQESARVVGATTDAIQQGQRTLQSEMEKVTNATKQTITAVTATAAEQSALRETVGHVMEAVTGIGARQTALSEAVQAHEQASAAATAALTGRQDQLAGDVRRLHELTQTVAGGVADVAREQGAARGAMQDGTKVISATIEVVQQGQKTLQTEVEEVLGATQQTIEALAATAAEQTAARETVGRVMEAVTGVGAKQTALSETVQAHEQASAAATAALAGRHDQLAGDVHRLHELTQTVAGGIADVVREQATVRGAMQDSAKVLSATTEAVQQGQRALQSEMEKMAETTKQTTAALTATAGEQTAVRETVKRVMEEVSGVGARQTALHEAVQAHGQALTGATAALAGGHEQLAADVRRLHELTQTVVGGVTDVAREQAAVRGATQDSTRVMNATIEAIQQGLRTLQTEVEKMVQTTTQTIAALTTTVTEQTTGQEITKRMIGELANAAMTALATGHGRLPGDVPQPQAPARTTGDPGLSEVGSPVRTEESNTPQRLSAARAITHGEQIRYEVGPDRDNLGFWTNASDWVEWELEVKRPGRFNVTAEIAALAPGRFQVVFGDQKLDGNAPNTSDYGRFQKVELGSVELTSCGKTRVAVRPIPEGWQPMNLKALDLVPLT
jgi:DNA repair exonuclease SbcCD ATPase subunit